MSNKFNIELKSKIIELQSKYLFSRMSAELGNKATGGEIAALVAQTIQRYYVNLGRPLMLKRYAEEDHLPFIEEYMGTIDEITEDATILYGEIQRIGDALAEHFNYAQSERLRLSNRIKNIGSASNDLNLLANENTRNSLYLRDSFIDESGIERALIMGRPAQISTREGIVTLARIDTVNRSNSASIKLIQGDGEQGTTHLVRRSSTSNVGGQFNSNAMYIADQTPNNNANVLLDGRPDTIFEYQMLQLDLRNAVNVTKNYDLAWAKDKDPNDRLRLKVTIDLGDAADINWININPYYPENSTGKIVVYSIRTSEDGFEYKPLYDGNLILNAEINTTPQTYRQDEIFDGKNDFSTSKFAGQGVWSFATRKAKYVEIVFDQAESYMELIGHDAYERVTNTIDPVSGQAREVAVRIPSSSVPEYIVKGVVGKYVISATEYIRKSIDIFDGIRYAIGIRDVNIMSYQFAEKSELVTKKFTLDKPIKEVMLYTNEKIPEAFLQDLRKVNDWIQYYVSFDDVNWHPISPVHRSPMSGTAFPPKIYELNRKNVDLQTSFQLYKGYVNTEQSPTSVRLKMVFQRPTNIYNASSYTPILEDYSLRIVSEDDLK